MPPPASASRAAWSAFAHRGRSAFSHDPRDRLTPGAARPIIPVENSMRHLANTLRTACVWLTMASVLLGGQPAVVCACLAAAKTSVETTEPGPRCCCGQCCSGPGSGGPSCCSAPDRPVAVTPGRADANETTLSSSPCRKVVDPLEKSVSAPKPTADEAQRAALPCVGTLDRDQDSASSRAHLSERGAPAGISSHSLAHLSRLII